ncbi:MAG: hypothetical protein GX443_09680 [Deltaproteobacteria bacterium]|nr:hypothetical protein [Deltaproteobacteria bacterium]
MGNVHVVDKRLFLNEADLHSFMRSLQRLPGDNAVFRVDGRWTIWGICRRVRELRGTVGILGLHCHGNASWLQLGPGLSLPAQTANFSVLRGCWVGRYPRIEIHACAVASATPIACSAAMATVESLPSVCTPGTDSPGSPGRALVQAIADNAGVLTIAAFNAQLIERLGFEGAVVYCRPATYATAAALIGP